MLCGKLPAISNSTTPHYNVVQMSGLFQKLPLVLESAIKDASTQTAFSGEVTSERLAVNPQKPASQS